jgi:hypothetical protein
MEFYTLDTETRREYIISRYKSYIWTERYSAFGDFELVIPATPANRQQLSPGVMLGCSDSFFVMLITTVNDAISDDGERMLTISGVSIEQQLEDRIAAAALTDTVTNPKWILAGTPAEICREIFYQICVVGMLDSADIFPLVTPGGTPTGDTNPEPSDVITVELEPQTVYAAIKALCDRWGLGFRMPRNEFASPLYFDIYTGNDRTSRQTAVPAVIFSPELENLKNTTELRSTANYKNAAYVFSPAGFELVYPDDVAASSEGFDRHVMMINMTDIEVGDPDASLKMIYKGYEELAKVRPVIAFDGEISQHSQYIYGTDYVLGDIVELRNSDNYVTYMRVTEQIFVSDEEGDRMYPTLSIVPFDESGSWALGYGYRKWEDFGPVEYWNVQP